MCSYTCTYMHANITHTHMCKFTSLRKRYIRTVSCPLKGSASLMRCAALCVCVCACVCVWHLYKFVWGREKAFHSRAPLMRSDTLIWYFWRSSAATGGGGPKDSAWDFGGLVCWVRSPPGKRKREKRVRLLELRKWGWAARWCFISLGITHQGFYFSQL